MADLASGRSDRAFHAANAILSALAVALLGWILVLHEPGGDPRALAFMPAVNAALNGASALLLAAAWLAIRSGRRELHRRLVFGALGASALFLAGYVTYHFVHGDTRYPGSGPLRTAYLVLLASHVLLSIAVLPMIGATLWLAGTGRLPRHRRLARWTMPIWLYVSATGVAVFAMLRLAA